MQPRKERSLRKKFLRFSLISITFVSSIYFFFGFSLSVPQSVAQWRLLSPTPRAFAQELHQNIQGIWRAKVIEVVSEEKRIIPGTETPSVYQILKAELLEGEKKGEIVTVENDFIKLKTGENFFLFYQNDINGKESYSVRDVDRRGTIIFFAAIFVLAVIAFGGRQGLRSLMSLAGSLFVILYLLVPSLLKGYSPITTSIVIASIILFLAIYLTHGFNRESTAAFSGTVIAVILTGFLAYFAVTFARLTGFFSDEAVYLNLNTRGALDFSGLLLGGIMIGVLGVLDDISITQSAIRLLLQRVE